MHACKNTAASIPTEIAPRPRVCAAIGYPQCLAKGVPDHPEGSTSFLVGKDIERWYR